jgi:hypothetical protein
MASGLYVTLPARLPSVKVKENDSMTSNKLALWLAAVTIPAVAMAGPKTYRVEFDHSVTAGAIQLEAGQYGVKVEGSNAIFKDSQTGQEFTVPVKVENSGKKYDATAIESNKEGSTEKIMEIDLGGSKTRLEFGQ